MGPLSRFPREWFLGVHGMERFMRMREQRRVSGKMVATRRGTRLEPQVEAKGGDGEQIAVQPGSPLSPKLGQKTVRKDSVTQDSGRNAQVEDESTISSGGSSKNDSSRRMSQVVTRSRRRSGPSDADISEAESATSNSSITRNRQNRRSLTDSTRKLRNHRSAVITEPILESKEDEEVSEAESNCSSISTRASRRIRARASNSTRASSRKSSLHPEPISDHSDAESNCSSVSSLQNIAVRSTRTLKATYPLSVNSESHKEETSEAESFNLDIVTQPSARHSSRRIQSKPQSDEAKDAVKTSSQEQELSKKQRYGLRGLKVIEPLFPGQEQKMLSTPRRSLRNRIVREYKDFVVLSDSDSQSKKFSNKDAHVDQPKDGESLEANLSAESKDSPSLEVNLSAEHCSVLDRKLPKTTLSKTYKDPDEIIELTEVLMDELQTKEQDQEKADSDYDNSETADVRNKDTLNKNTETQSESCSLSNFTENVDMSLVLDSDESEESEHSEQEVDIDIEDEENYADFVKKQKPKQTSTKQSRDVIDNDLFVIDKAPGLDSSRTYYVDQNVDDKASEKNQIEKEKMSEPDEEEEDFIDEEADDDDDDDDNEEDGLLNRPKRGFDLSTSIDTGLSIKELGGLYISFDAEKSKPGPSLQNKMKKESKKQDELLKNSVITPDFEKRESVPPYKQSLNKLKKQRKAEREKTTGQGWFDMKAPEMTEELKNDLKALKMRSAMDPKRFYKKDDREGFPKYFQVGTVVDSPLDYYHSRIPKKQRKRTIVEELIADSEFRRYNKKKYQEIIADKVARAEGKKNRKKKKFCT